MSNDPSTATPDSNNAALKNAVSSVAAPGKAAPDNVVALFDREATDWDDRYQHASFRNREETFLRLFEHVDIADRRWLDAGCGSARFSRLLAARGATVKGVDASPQMIEAARKLSHDRTTQTFETIETLERLAEPTAAYDGVFCSSVLEYVPRPELAIAEFARILKPDGSLLLSVPHRKSWVRRVQKFCYATTRLLGMRPRPGYLEFSKHDFTKSDLHGLLAKHGFEVLETTQYSATTKFNDATLLVVLARRLSDAT